MGLDDQTRGQHSSNKFAYSLEVGKDDMKLVCGEGIQMVYVHL
jgi:hypothetical protein